MHLNAFVGGKKTSTVTEQRTDCSLLHRKGGNLIVALQQLDATFHVKGAPESFFFLFSCEANKRKI